MKETQIYDADELAERWEYLYAKKTIKDIKKRLEVDYKRGNWHALHIALWVWLAMDGERAKSEWFDKFNIPEVEQYCFACEEAKISFYCCPPTKSTSEEEEGCCNYCIKPSCRYYCPLTDSAAEECHNGLYDEWWAADSEQKEKLARKIATMKWEERL